MRYFPKDKKLFVRGVVLRTLVAIPIALDRASEAHAVRVDGQFASFAKQDFPFGIVAVAQVAWTGVARHHSQSVGIPSHYIRHELTASGEV